MDLDKSLDLAERRAKEALAANRFMFFGYWTAAWAALNRLAGSPRSNPFRELGQKEEPVMNTAIEKATDFIKREESLHKLRPDGRVEAYSDPIHGWAVPTIGYGTTRYPDGRKVRQGDIITKAQAVEFMAHEITREIKPALEKIPTWERMNTNQKAALYSFAYNLGPHFYGGRNFTSITKVFDTPSRWTDADWIMAQFVKYRNPGTPAERGLRLRREREALLFLELVD